MLGAVSGDEFCVHKHCLERKSVEHCIASLTRYLLRPPPLRQSDVAANLLEISDLKVELEKLNTEKAQFVQTVERLQKDLLLTERKRDFFYNEVDRVRDMCHVLEDSCENLKGTVKGLEQNKSDLEGEGERMR